MALWNPWHGCRKISAGCVNCYVYRTDSKFGKDSSSVEKTLSFDLPIQKKKNGDYKIRSGETVYTCFTSDFFIDEADKWRKEAWKMIDLRHDADFLIVTKRIDRFLISLPENWGEGYENVCVCCTAENNERAEYRLPVFLGMPIRHRQIICEPLLEPINLSPYLTDAIEGVIVGGESGENARLCKYEWVVDIRNQCEKAGVSFSFKQTGANFEKNGRIYKIERRFQHSQAKKANIDIFR